MRKQGIATATVSGENPGNVQLSVKMGKSMTNKQSNNTAPSKSKNESVIRLFAFSTPSRLKILINVGTNAAVSAPSANILRNELGKKNAAVNASAINPTPKKLTCKISRVSPKSLLTNV